MLSLLMLLLRAASEIKISVILSKVVAPQWEIYGAFKWDGAVLYTLAYTAFAGIVPGLYNDVQ